MENRSILDLSLKGSRRLAVILENICVQIFRIPAPLKEDERHSIDQSHTSSDKYMPLHKNNRAASKFGEHHSHKKSNSERHLENYESPEFLQSRSQSHQSHHSSKDSRRKNSNEHPSDEQSFSQNDRLSSKIEHKGKSAHSSASRHHRLAENSRKTTAPDQLVTEHVYENIPSNVSTRSVHPHGKLARKGKMPSALEFAYNNTTKKFHNTSP